MSHPETDSPRDLAAAYALGTLAPEEVRVFEAYLASAPDVAGDVEEYREVAALLGLGASATGAADPTRDPLSDTLRERVLARVAGGKTATLPQAAESRPTGPSRMLIRVALAASVLLAVGLAMMLASSRRDIAQRETALVATARQLTEREATLNSLLEPGVRLYQLTATGDPEPLIQLYWDRQRSRALVHAFRLRPAPNGRVYQLWFIRDGKPVPSVTFQAEATGHALVQRVSVPAGGKISAAAVTLEPDGGSTAPTMPILLICNIAPS